MTFDPPLQPARLLKRYKRFLADVQTPQGELLTIHCANTGAMTGCMAPGWQIWYSTSDNPRRKYPHSWEWSDTPEGERIGVNTARANTLAVEAIVQQQIPELAGYAAPATEVRYGREGSRIDIRLSGANRPDAYIEVKSVTLLQEGQGYFPDAVTTRGQKHLRELMAVARNGQRAVLLFAVQHSGIRSVRAAAHIDPKYAKLLAQAMESGVEVLCYATLFRDQQMLLARPLPFIPA